MKFKVLIASALVVFAVGCSGQKDASDADTSSHAAQSESETAVVSQGEANTVVMTVSGTVGCGHCDFQVGTSCSAAVKTESGDIVILTGVDSGGELFKDRMSGKAVSVTGSDAGVREGQQYLKVESYEM